MLDLTTPTYHGGQKHSLKSNGGLGKLKNVGMPGVPGFRAQGLGFGVWGLGFGVWGLGFRV